MIGNINRLLIILFLSALTLSASGQQKTKNSVLLSGVVLKAKNGEELPFVNISIKNTFYGTTSDINGYFSLFINPGDTLEFSYVGYEDASFVMPFKRDADQYSLLQLMRDDTITLEEVVVFPWPDYDNFTRAFLDTTPPRTMEDLIVEVKQDLNQTLEEAEKSKYYYEQQRYQRLFMMDRNVFPPNNFLDPSRWADFIRDLKNDDEDQGELDDY